MKTTHRIQNNVVEIPKSLAQEILEYLDKVEDEGPVYTGWKSDNLLNCIGLLRTAIDNGTISYS